MYEYESGKERKRFMRVCVCAVVCVHACACVSTRVCERSDSQDCFYGYCSYSHCMIHNTIMHIKNPHPHICVSCRHPNPKNIDLPPFPASDKEGPEFQYFPRFPKPALSFEADNG